MIYPIEKNIPIPENLNPDRPFNQKYHLTTMEVGDSFIFEYKTHRELQNFKGAIRKVRCVNNKDFVVQHIDDELKLRCWRTK